MDKEDLKQALIKCIDNDAPFFLMFDDGGVSAVAVNLRHNHDK